MADCLPRDTCRGGPRLTVDERYAPSDETGECRSILGRGAARKAALASSTQCRSSNRRSRGLLAADCRQGRGQPVEQGSLRQGSLRQGVCARTGHVRAWPPRSAVARRLTEAAGTSTSSTGHRRTSPRRTRRAASHPGGGPHRCGREAASMVSPLRSPNNISASRRRGAKASRLPPGLQRARATSK